MKGMTSGTKVSECLAAACGGALAGAAAGAVIAAGAGAATVTDTGALAVATGKLDDCGPFGRDVAK
jgi:hypothetical protein